MEKFVKSSRLKAPADEVFNFHFRDGALERFTQPWSDVKMLSKSGGITDGGRVTLQLKQGPFKQIWEAEHRDYVPGRQFKDILVKGPFAFWEHTHSVEPAGDEESILTDSIIYKLPWYVPAKKMRKELERIFTYRHALIENDMRIREEYLKKNGKELKILIAGSSGLVGSALVPFLTTQGHHVNRLVRAKDDNKGEVIFWDPENEELDASKLEGFDAIINLAGDNLADGRWTKEKKKKILESRLKTTHTLSKAIQKLKNPPKVFVNASAIGYYGARGNETVDESSQSGTGFLADVCRQWEAAAQQAKREGVRVVLLRTGVVISPRGGVISKLSIPFQLGLGGIIGSGKQWMSWISIDDLVAIIFYLLVEDHLEGPVDAVSPNQVTNEQFTKTLGKVYNRPTVLPVPGFIAQCAFGEMADEMLLGGVKVEPSKLEKAGYKFLYSDLEKALRHLLGRK